VAACARAGIEPGDVRSVCCGRTGAECKLPLDLLSSVPPGCSQRAPKPLRARSVTGRLMRPSRSRTSAASSAGRGSRRAPLATSKYPSRSRVPRTAPTTQCRYTYRRQIRPLHTYARPFAQQFPRLTSAPTSAAPQRGGGVGAQLLPLPTASSGRAQHSDFLNIGILGGLPAPHANNSDHAKMTPLTNQAPELSISFCRPLTMRHAPSTCTRADACAYSYSCNLVALGSFWLAI
jgi:hypothetical protein